MADKGITIEGSIAPEQHIDPKDEKKFTPPPAESNSGSDPGFSSPGPAINPGFSSPGPAINIGGAKSSGGPIIGGAKPIIIGGAKPIIIGGAKPPSRYRHSAQESSSGDPHDDMEAEGI